MLIPLAPTRAYALCGYYGDIYDNDAFALVLADCKEVAAKKVGMKLRHPSVRESDNAGLDGPEEKLHDVLIRAHADAGFACLEELRSEMQLYKGRMYLQPLGLITQDEKGKAFLLRGVMKFNDRIFHSAIAAVLADSGEAAAEALGMDVRHDERDVSGHYGLFDPTSKTHEVIGAAEREVQFPAHKAFASSHELYLGQYALRLVALIR